MIFEELARTGVKRRFFCKRGDAFGHGYTLCAAFTMLMEREGGDLDK